MDYVIIYWDFDMSENNAWIPLNSQHDEAYRILPRFFEIMMNYNRNSIKNNNIPDQDNRNVRDKYFRNRSFRNINFILFFSVILLCLCALTSCRKEKDGNTGISILIHESVTKDGMAVQIPEFRSGSEEVQKQLRELEKQTNTLEKICEREESRGSHMEMRSYVDEVKNYPQVTVVWFVAEEDIHTYNLMSLCADEKQGLPITCKEALEMTGLTGVELSLRVGRLQKEMKIRGELSSTEMQGFRIDESGKVTEIYMKLTMKVEEEDQTIEEEHFFSYSPDEEKLVRLSERGFDIP